MIAVHPSTNVSFGVLPQVVPGTYFIQTWGCQMNEEDSEQMALYLGSLGLRSVDSIMSASVVILNTCSVRKKPEDKAFSLLGELIPLKKRNPSVVIGVCGCMAQIRADEIRRRAPHVDFVLGTGDLGLLPGLVEESLRAKRFQKRLELPDRKGRTVIDVPQRHLGRAPKLKAYVPIQYGCDKFCTFCIVPSTRGRERSRPMEHIVDEVRSMAANGTREVTLLGQTVNSYGKGLEGGPSDFSDLLWKLADIPGLARIRYTSPYPRDFNSKLIETIRDCPKVMEHCHLPLQSGDNETLRQMHRVYTVESYSEIASNLRQQIPGVALTTDIIVGFPGETDEQFDRTLDFMDRQRFHSAYMFAYSTRPGTKAGDRVDQVPDDVKKDRLHRLMELQSRICLQVHSEYLDREVEVLVEGRSPKKPGLFQGYTRDFKMTHFLADDSQIGHVRPARVTASHLWGLSVELR